MRRAAYRGSDRPTQCLFYRSNHGKPFFLHFMSRSILATLASANTCIPSCLTEHDRAECPGTLQRGGSCARGSPGTEQTYRHFRTDAGAKAQHETSTDDVVLDKHPDIKSGGNSRHASSSPSRSSSVHYGGEQTIVSFPRGDPENPYNWSLTKKMYVTLTCMALVMNSTIGSALPSGASKQTAEYFHITNDSLLVLPVFIYLIGYVLGPLVSTMGQALLVNSADWEGLRANE